MKIFIFKENLFYSECFTPFKFGGDIIFLYINSYFIETNNLNIVYYFDNTFEYSIRFNLKPFDKTNDDINHLFLILKYAYKIRSITFSKEESYYYRTK
jgi:hypothetical protein